MRSHRFVGLCESKEGKTFARRDSRSEVDFSHFRRREKSLGQIWGPCSRSRLGRPPHTGGLPHQFWLQQEQVPFQHCNTKHTTVPTPPRTELWTSLKVENDRVTSVTVGLMSQKKEKGEDFDLAVDVTSEFCYPCYGGQQPYSTQFGWDHRSNRPFGLLVRLTPASTPAQRHSAYDLNLACLTKFGGCKDARSFLPELWDRTEVEQLK